MAVLSDAWTLVLNVLLEAPVAWRSPEEIAAALGWGEGEVTDLLCDLDVAGWLVVWETETGPLVTLSPLAAERLRVRLVEVGAGETPRWAREGEPDPPSPRSKHVCLNERAASLNFVPDPADSPDVSAVQSERTEAFAKTRSEGPPLRPGRRDEPPRPTVLLGLSLTPWPGPGVVSQTTCPACRGRTLGPQTYCLYCDRWGLDGPNHGGVVPPVAVPATTRTATDRSAIERRQAERLRARRKAKRKRRQQAKREASRQQNPSVSPVPATTRVEQSQPSS
jgi:hypothetical protein